MKIVEPSINILTPINSIKFLKDIELAARTCYKSENNITDDDDSAKKIIKMLLDNHHEAMIEFGDDITVKIITDIGAQRDLSRHRHISMACESTRYCSYNKGKYGSELTFIKPCNIEEDTEEYKLWFNCMKNIEENYMKMAELKCKPDQMRLTLPLSTKTEFCLKANIREWRHILRLRTSIAAHPSVQQVMKMILYKFKEQLPILFDDILTNEEEERNKIIDMLKNGVVSITFNKVDGTVRTLNNCTLNSELLPLIEEEKINTNKKSHYNPSNIVVYDTLEGWKTIRVKSIIEIKQGN